MYSMNIQDDRHEFKMVYDIYYTNGTRDLSKWFEISQPRPVRSPLISPNCRPSPGPCPARPMSPWASPARDEHCCSAVPKDRKQVHTCRCTPPLICGLRWPPVFRSLALCVDDIWYSNSFLTFHHHSSRKFLIHLNGGSRKERFSLHFVHTIFNGLYRPVIFKFLEIVIMC